MAISFYMRDSWDTRDTWTGRRRSMCHVCPMCHCLKRDTPGGSWLLPEHQRIDPIGNLALGAVADLGGDQPAGLDHPLASRLDCLGVAQARQPHLALQMTDVDLAGLRL